MLEEYVAAAIAGRFGSSRDRREMRQLSFLRSMFDIGIVPVYCRTKNMRQNESLLPNVMTMSYGMCLPGTARLYVAPDGAFHPCERLPSEAPAFRIGDIADGFDVEAITAICDQQVAFVEDRCTDCWNIRTCEIPCAGILGPDGTLSRESKLRECEVAKRGNHRVFITMCRILEENENGLDFLNSL